MFYVCYQQDWCHADVKERAPERSRAKRIMKLSLLEFYSRPVQSCGADSNGTTPLDGSFQPDLQNPTPSPAGVLPRGCAAVHQIRRPYDAKHTLDAIADLHSAEGRGQVSTVPTSRWIVCGIEMGSARFLSKNSSHNSLESSLNCSRTGAQ